MQDLVYDVLIFLLFIGIMTMMINLFGSNIDLISQSSTSKNVELSQIKEDKTADSIYTTVDLLGYINEFKAKEEQDIQENLNKGLSAEPNQIDSNITITDGTNNYVVDNSNRLTDLNLAISYLKSVENSTKYKYYRESKLFVKS